MIPKFMIAWFVFCVSILLTTLGFTVWVIIKLLAHFGVI